jgi:hypothetical protein
MYQYVWVVVGEVDIKIQVIEASKGCKYKWIVGICRDFKAWMWEQVTTCGLKVLWKHECAVC